MLSSKPLDESDSKYNLATVCRGAMQEIKFLLPGAYRTLSDQLVDHAEGAIAFSRFEEKSPELLINRLVRDEEISLGDFENLMIAAIESEPQVVLQRRVIRPDADAGDLVMDMAFNALPKGLSKLDWHEVDRIAVRGYLYDGEGKYMPAPRGASDLPDVWHFEAEMRNGEIETLHECHAGEEGRSFSQLGHLLARYPIYSGGVPMDTSEVQSAACLSAHMNDGQAQLDDESETAMVMR